jgi:sensor histidine kinase YesM
MKIKIAILLFHLLLWWLVVQMLAIVLREPGIDRGERIIFFVVTLVTGVLTFYLQFYLSKRYIYNGFSLKWLFCSVLLLVAVSILYYFALESNFINKGTTGTDNSIEYPKFYALPVVLSFSIAGIMYQGFHYTFLQKRKEQELKTDKLNLELNLIRSQLNPHFLFNVLNNVDSYVRNDPRKASESIVQLSSLLRYLLYETAHALVPIESEIKFIEDYIDLQRQRLQHPEYCNFRKEISDSSKMIAPALFLPYIENAFIHCPLNERGALLNFGIRSQSDKTVFTAQNTRVDSLTPIKVNGGLGMELAKKRLDVLYPNRYSLHIVPAETVYIVELVIHHNDA